MGDKRQIVIKEGGITVELPLTRVSGTVEGKFVVIVDDLVQTGGTLLSCAEVGTR